MIKNNKTGMISAKAFLHSITLNDVNYYRLEIKDFDFDEWIKEYDCKDINFELWIEKDENKWGFIE